VQPQGVVAPTSQRSRTLTFVVGAIGLWTLLLFAVFEQRLVNERQVLADQFTSRLDAMREEVTANKAAESHHKGSIDHVEPLLTASEAPHESSSATAPAANKGPAPPTKGSTQGGQKSPPKARKLGGIMSVAASGSQTGSEGCLTWSAAATLDVSSTTCANSLKCPFCYIFTGGSAATTLTVKSCSTHLLHQTASIALTTSMAAEYVFMNNDGTNVAIIQSVTSAGTVTATYHLLPYHSVVAYCYGNGGDQLLFPYDGTTHAGTSVSAGYCPMGCDAAAPNYKSAANGGAAFSYKGFSGFTGSTVVQKSTCAQAVCTDTTNPGQCGTNNLATGCIESDFTDVSVTYR